VLPHVSGNLLKYLENCLRAGYTWADCISRLLEEHFPYFVLERLVRNLIVFKFHVVGEP
jgi:hypothetical protein